MTSRTTRRLAPTSVTLRVTVPLRSFSGSELTALTMDIPATIPSDVDLDQRAAFSQRVEIAGQTITFSVPKEHLTAREIAAGDVIELRHEGIDLPAETVSESFPMLGGSEDKPVQIGTRCFTYRVPGLHLRAE